MSQASDYLENKLIRLVLHAEAYAGPVSGIVYVALSTANPLDDASGLAEPLTASGYARLPVQSGFTFAPNGVGSNTSGLEFAAATGDWGTISHFALFDAVSGGNMLVYSGLAAAVGPITSGIIARFPAGYLVADCR